MNYLYDFELSTKRKTILWLYQVIPNLDILQYIYKLKEQAEYEDTLSYYGVCPNNVIGVCDWNHNDNLSNSWTVINTRDIMKINALLIQLIVTPELICSFELPTPMTNQDRELIVNGFWEFVATTVNYTPRLSDKLECINKIINESPYFLADICSKLHTLLKMYKSANFTELNHLLDNTPDFVRIGVDNHKNWHIPTIYF